MGRLTPIFVRSLPSQVNRAYDTRFRYTPRRPDLYATFAPPKDGVAGAEPDVSVVCRISDLVHDVGKDGPRSVVVDVLDVALRDDRGPTKDASDRMEWMWKLRGKLVVISIPFVKGKHFASNIEDFIPVVQALRSMHEAGYVHGDIRCFNIIFGKGLIDFDFGGQIDKEPKYPPGYQDTLRDGMRLGKAGQNITKWHDWFALIHVIFLLHSFYYPKDESPDLVRRFIELQRNARPDVVENIPTDLDTFLKKVKDTWQVTPSTAFKPILSEYHLGAEADGTLDQGGLATETATPSPPDKKKLFA
jgi:hypothetical protein